MRYFSNLHTHTTFCDGKDTAEEVVLKAIELGYCSIGFSGHSYTHFDPEPSMSREETLAYREEILRLREKYGEKIEIYLGIEQDVLSDKPDFECDYMIGSLHYLKIGDEYVSVDNTSAIAEKAVDKHFSGDWLAYCEAYYANAKDVARITGCDIVGHFDLVTKFNDGGRYFDENSLRYRIAAADALRYEAQFCNLFEINTGGIYRKKRSVPYPSEFLLRQLHKIGGEIVFSSDSHDKNSLGFMFSEAAELARHCGFKYAKILQGGKFRDVLL